MELSQFQPFFMHNLILFVLALLVDYLMGDPVYRLHPVRLMGNLLAFLEKILFRFGLNDLCPPIA